AASPACWAGGVAATTVVGVALQRNAAAATVVEAVFAAEAAGAMLTVVVAAVSGPTMDAAATAVVRIRARIGLTAVGGVSVAVGIRGDAGKAADTETAAGLRVRNGGNGA